MILSEVIFFFVFIIVIRVCLDNIKETSIIITDVIKTDY